jgi:hypothetical protein
MKKISKSDMTREQEAYYDAVLSSMRKNQTTHFTPGSRITSGYRKATIIGRARHLLWIWWDEGGTEIIEPIALSEGRWKYGYN